LKNFYLAILSFLLFNNCSFNTNSKFWTDDNIKKKEFEKKLLEINAKSKNIISLSFDEFKIYVEEYVKKEKYPDISK